MRIRDIIKDNWLDRLHINKMVDFKGGSKQTTTRNIPAQTAAEAQLQGGLMNYVLPGIQQSANLQNQAITAAGNTYNPNYGTLANEYNTTMGNIASGYQGLISGNLPSQYAANRQSALQTDLDNTIGSSINSLANRGVLNSSVTNKSLQGISNSVADTLAKNYTSDINTVSGLLGQQANQAGNTLTNNAAAQQSSYFQPSQLFDYAQKEYAPAANLFNQLYSGRMGTGSQTTTSNDGGAGAMQGIASLGSAAILCFIGRTVISTPTMDKSIKDIKVGDKVISIDENDKPCIETVLEVQDPCISPNEYVFVNIKAKKGETAKRIGTTSTQPFFTDQGEVLVGELPGKTLIGLRGKKEVVSVEANPVKELVYDFKTTGRNIYFADGFAVRGM